MTIQTQLDAIGIAVDDMARSLAFYRELGLDVPKEADDAPHVDFELPGGLRLMWDTVDTMRSFAPDWQPPSSGSPRMGLAFRVPTPDDVDAAYERIMSLGYGSYMAPWDAFWGMRYAVVLDPDGTHVDLFCPNDAPSSP